MSVLQDKGGRFLENDVCVTRQGTAVGFQNIICVLQERGIPENDFCAARPRGGGAENHVMLQDRGGGLFVSEKPRPHQTTTAVSSHIPGTRHNRKGARGKGGGGAGGAQLYTIGQRGSQGLQNNEFQKFSATTGKRVGFAPDLALILPINVGDQGDPGSRGMHTLLVFGGISTVKIVTKTFWNDFGPVVAARSLASGGALTAGQPIRAAQGEGRNSNIGVATQIGFGCMKLG